MSEEKKAVENQEVNEEAKEAAQAPQKQEEKKTESFFTKFKKFTKNPKVVKTAKRLPGLILEIIGGLLVAVKVYDKVTGGKSYTVVDRDAYNSLLEEAEARKALADPDHQESKFYDDVVETQSTEM
jgi:hypothetical protein